MNTFSWLLSDDLLSVLDISNSIWRIILIGKSDFSGGQTISIDSGHNCAMVQCSFLTLLMNDKLFFWQLIRGQWSRVHIVSIEHFLNLFLTWQLYISVHSFYVLFKKRPLDGHFILFLLDSQRNINLLFAFLQLFHNTLNIFFLCSGIRSGFKWVHERGSITLDLAGDLLDFEQRLFGSLNVPEGLLLSFCFWHLQIKIIPANKLPFNRRINTILFDQRLNKH